MLRLSACLFCCLLSHDQSELSRTALQHSFCRSVALDTTRALLNLYKSLKTFQLQRKSGQSFVPTFFAAVDIDFGSSMVFFNRYLILSLYFCVFFNFNKSHRALLKAES